CPRPAWRSTRGPRRKPRCTTSSATSAPTGEPSTSGRTSSRRGAGRARRRMGRAGNRGAGRAARATLRLRDRNVPARRRRPALNLRVREHSLILSVSEAEIQDEGAIPGDEVIDQPAEQDGAWAEPRIGLVVPDLLVNVIAAPLRAEDEGHRETFVLKDVGAE